MAIARRIAKKSQLNTSQAMKDSAYSIVIFFFFIKKTYYSNHPEQGSTDLYNTTYPQISSIFMPILLANSTKFGKDVCTLSTSSILMSYSDLLEAIANDIEMRWSW